MPWGYCIGRLRCIALDHDDLLTSIRFDGNRSLRCVLLDDFRWGGTRHGVRLKKGNRVERPPIVAHLKVKVSTRSVSAPAHSSNRVAESYLITRVNEQPAEMSIKRRKALAMVDHYRSTVPALPPGSADYAVSRHPISITVLAIDINSLMRRPYATWLELSSDPPA